MQNPAPWDLSGIHGSFFSTFHSEGFGPRGLGRGKETTLMRGRTGGVLSFHLGAGPCVICLGAGGGGVVPTEVGGGWSVFHVFSEMGPWGSGSTVGVRWGAGHAGGLVTWMG